MAEKNLNLMVKNALEIFQVIISVQSVMGRELHRIIQYSELFCQTKVDIHVGGRARGRQWGPEKFSVRIELI